LDCGSAKKTWRKLAAYLEMVTVSLSFKLTFEANRQEIDKQTITSANLVQQFAVQHLHTVIRTNLSLFQQFKDCNGFQIVVDVLSQLNSSSVALEVLAMISLAVDTDSELTILFTQFGVLEYLTKLLRDLKFRHLQDFVFHILYSMTKPQIPYNRMILYTMPEEMLQFAISTTISLENRLKALLILIALRNHPTVEECVLDRLKDGTTTRAVFNEILSLSKEAILANFNLYPQRCSVGDMDHGLRTKDLIMLRVCASLYK
jgi:hypothetical protein